MPAHLIKASLVFMKWRVFLNQELILIWSAHVVLISRRVEKTSWTITRKMSERWPNLPHAKLQSLFQLEYESFYIFFPSDCGVCNLSCHDCWLNYRKATGVSRFFCTCCFVFNINRHLPCLSYPRNHRRMWTTVTGSSNNWLYYKASHHGPR